MSMKLRLAIFLSAFAAGLAALPIRAADAVLAPAGPRIALGNDAQWNLRPGAGATGERVVRVVYPGLFEPR